MPKFIPGLKLNEAFYHEVVALLMHKHFPKVKYSAGLVGHGSDVLGFDGPTSMDHDWGPHLQIFLSEPDFIAYKNLLDKMLRMQLPYTYKGFSTNFLTTDTYLSHKPKKKKSGEINHIFGFWTIQSFFFHYVGFDPYKQLTVKEWLTFPQQALIEVTSGQLFHDDLELEKIRQRFSYYPLDIWFFMLKMQWIKITDESSFQARTGQEGDEVGSMVVAARMVQKIMSLAFMIERQYLPYAKWFGTAFLNLQSGKKLYPHMKQILYEKNWGKRQKYMAKAAKILAQRHNELTITDKLPIRFTKFPGRNYLVLDTGVFIHKLHNEIKNEQLKNLKYPLGVIDQFIDHTHINHINYVYNEFKDIVIKSGEFSSPYK